MNEAETLEPIADQLLPLDAWHDAQGARMVSFAGYRMPIQYEGIMAEHLWTRAHAGLFDVSHMGQLLVSGPGAEEALETLLPADLKGLERSRMRYSLLLASNGGILDDLMVTRVTDPFPFASGKVETRSFTAPGTNGPERSQAFYLVVNGAAKYDDIAHIHDHLPEDVTLNHMEDHALLALQGPEAVTALSRLVQGVAALTFMTAGMFDLDGIPLWISRSGYTGEDGFELSVSAASAEMLARRLSEEPEVKPVGLGARDSLRLEAGLPLYGHDLDPDTTPIMADLGFALSKRRREEGGFPGAERLMLERQQGSVTKRVGLTIEGRQPVREGALVLGEGGDTVGRVTSGGFSPSLERPIAMAYVPAVDAVPGTTVQIEQRGKIFLGTATPMPFVPHRYHR